MLASTGLLLFSILQITPSAGEIILLLFNGIFLSGSLKNQRTKIVIRNPIIPRVLKKIPTVKDKLKKIRKNL